MAPRLKTFITSDGLTEYIVAASSKPKALAAWGVRQDLFKEGRAHETDDPELVKLAEAAPGEVITRRLVAKVADLPSAEVIPFKPRPRARPEPRAKAAPPAKAKPPPKPWSPAPADVRRVADLERRLQAHEARYAETRDALAMERRRLDEREARERSRYRNERDDLEGKLAAAKRRLRPS